MTSAPDHADSIPLVVDVDGTLILGDTLHEALVQFLVRHPLDFWRILPWTIAGKAVLKRNLAERVSLACQLMPYRLATIELIEGAQRIGRPVYLASAANAQWVEAIASGIGQLSGVFASTGTVNLSGGAKADRLNAAFGEHGYDYVGNSRQDLAVWRSARRAFVVDGDRRLLLRIEREFPDAEILSRSALPLKAVAAALRPHQWAKNLLVLLPLVAGHRFTPAYVVPSVLAFGCFCFAASGTYVFNDLIDVPSDRAHPAKRHRPFAAGHLSVPFGLLLGTALLVAAVLLALLLPLPFMLVLAVYLVGTTAYSLSLKRRAVMDIVTLGALYTIRVIGGFEAGSIPHSQWLLMFSFCLFTCLAIVKRLSELVVWRSAATVPASGRGYRVVDLQVLLPFAGAAGFSAVLVFAQYISSPEVVPLYRHPDVLWLACPLMVYWIGRVLILANRGELHHDPVVFAITDRISWLAGACVALILLLAV